MCPRPRPHRGPRIICKRVRTFGTWDCINARQRERAKECRFAACTSLLASPATRRPPPNCGAFRLRPRGSRLRQTACWREMDSNYRSPISGETLGSARSAGHVCGAAARIRRPAASASDDAVLTQARDSSGVEVERAAHRNFCDLADNELIKAVEKRTGTTRTKRRRPRWVSGPEPIKIVPRRYRPERRAGTSSRRRSLVTLALPAQPQLAPARRLGSIS